MSDDSNIIDNDIHVKTIVNKRNERAWREGEDDGHPRK